MSGAEMISREEAIARVTVPGARFEIRTENVLGERLEVYANRERSLGSLVRASARFGPREYLVTAGRRITFAQHYAAVAALAAALRAEYGVRKGDRVGICSANTPEWIVAFWAAVSLGAIAVGMNSMWAAPEVRHGIELTSPKVLIADAPRRAVIRDAGIGDAGIGDAGIPGTPAAPVLSFEADLPVLIARHQGAVLPDAEADEDDPAVILFTSGTSGRAKGVTHSHRNVLAAMWHVMLGDAIAAERGMPPQPGRRFLLLSPLFHITSLHNLAVPRLAAGDTAVIYSGRFEIDRVLALIEAERITNWGAVPTMVSRLVRHPGLAKYDLSSLRALSVNSAPSSPELKDQVRTALPVAGQALVTTYGLTESSTAATVASPVDLLEDPDTVGGPVPTVGVSIRDAAGNEVPDGTEGEIWLRGAQMMLGYWNDLAATAASSAPHGWFRTGDLGTMRDGRLRVPARRSDLILRGGENVYPAEVEFALGSHPAVSECAVFGVPHADLGQEVAAVVVVASGDTVTEDDLTAYARERLARYKVPSRWLITTDALPRNATGKVIRPAAAALLSRTAQPR
jgi:acyl-CoA synthetase (AMP-forming)/AMP-acid ligase II